MTKISSPSAPVTVPASEARLYLTCPLLHLLHLRTDAQPSKWEPFFSAHDALGEKAKQNAGIFFLTFRHHANQEDREVLLNSSRKRQGLSSPSRVVLATTLQGRPGQTRGQREAG